MEILEILNNNKESNFNNINFFKSPPLFFYNLYSSYKFYSMQIAQAIILNINTNKHLSI